MKTFLALVALIFGAQGAWADTQPDDSHPRYLVAFRAGVGQEDRRRLLKSMGLTDREELDLSEAMVSVAEARQGLVHKAALENLQDDPNVVAVEPDVYYPNWLLAVSETGPGAAMQDFGEIQSQIRFRASPSGSAADGDENIPWGVRRVHAPELWRRGDGRSQGFGVRVAVLDTGIDCSHPDLDCDLGEGYNAIDASVPPKDDQWHGTHVAGIIAAKWHDSKIVGVAPQARLIPIKVLDKKGGSAVSSIVKGILWAADHHVQIANMSFGAPVSSSIMHMAILYASEMKGVTFIAAAGNQGPGADTVTYPAAYAEVISVAASGQNSDGSDSLAAFSSRGRISFIAPGVRIFSCVPGGYAYHTGTSMAAPHVAGLAALAAAYGADGRGPIASALAGAARPIISLSADEEGAGMVDAELLAPPPLIASNN